MTVFGDVVHTAYFITIRLIVTGDKAGRVFFFDKRVKLLYWLTEIGLGTIQSIGFGLSDCHCSDSFKMDEGDFVAIAPINLFARKTFTY